ncbi:MAG: parvulin peptidyl-prolyl isomerase, partial [Frankiales bacterium]|nr:parvulin peptidyl-prolyl isomerase [Frankiales bacterium]
VVSEAALSRHVELLKALYGLVPPAEGAPEADRFRRDAAKSLAVSMVIERAAADRHVVVADRVVDDTLARFVERQYPEGRASFLSALGEQGVNEAAVRGEVARQVQVRRLYDQVTKDAAVTPQEVRAAYDKDPAAFALPPLRDVREIVVRTKEEAVALLGRLRAGADFTEAARTQSLDSSTSTQGGALGKVARVQLDETFGPAAFSARVGDYFGPVPSPQGYSYVGKVVSEDPARQRPFAEVRQEVEDQLLEAERAGLWRDFLRDRIKAAHVEYADAYRPADPGAAPSDVLPSAPLGTAASAGPTGSAAPFVGPTR